MAVYLSKTFSIHKLNSVKLITGIEINMNYNIYLLTLIQSHNLEYIYFLDFSEDLN